MAPWIALPLMLLVTLPLNILLSGADGSAPVAPEGIGVVTVVQLIVLGIGLAIGVVCALLDTQLATRWRLLVLLSYLPVVMFATLLLDG